MIANFIEYSDHDMTMMRVIMVLGDMIITCLLKHVIVLSISLCARMVFARVSPHMSATDTAHQVIPSGLI